MGEITSADYRSERLLRTRTVYNESNLLRRNSVLGNTIGEKKKLSNRAITYSSSVSHHRRAALPCCEESAQLPATSSSKRQTGNAKAMADASTIRHHLSAGKCPHADSHSGYPF